MSNLPKSVLSIQEHTQAIVATVSCRELDHVTIQQLKRDLELALAAAPQSSLVLDLSQVEFLPSLAMATLVNTHKSLKQDGRKCLLVGIQPLVHESLQVTALHRFFEIHGTIDDGLKNI